MSDAYDAVVVGAGPAGASLAIFLARAGWRVALIEKQSFPRRKVCGECIAASNLPLLDALGIGAEVEAMAGAPLERIALWRGDASIEAALPRAAGPARLAYGRALGRETLDTLLVARARHVGAEVLQPAALLQVEGRPGDFRCRVRVADGSASGSERELGCRLVVAAHGSWEPLPSERAARRRERRPSDLFAFKANFTGANLAPGLLPVLAFDGGYGGTVVADQGVTTLACCVREAKLAEWRGDAAGGSAGEAVQRHLVGQSRHVATMLEGATREGPWLASGPLQPGIRVDACDDGIFRIGNAAGEAHPIVGEGISMALQSAWSLAALLEAERTALLAGNQRQSETTQRSLLAAHAVAWRSHFSRRLAIAAAFAHVAMRPRLSATLWPLLRTWPGVLTHGARWAGKTEAVVAKGPLPRPLAA